MSEAFLKEKYRNNKFVKIFCLADETSLKIVYCTVSSDDNKKVFK